MNEREAVERIWDAAYDKLKDKEIKELVDKYGANRLYIFNMKDFYTFCGKRFPHECVYAAAKVLDSVDNRSFNQDDAWGAWDEERETFKSSNEMILLLCDINAFTDIIKKAVMDKSPILNTLGVNDAMDALLDNQGE